MIDELIEDLRKIEGVPSGTLNQILTAYNQANSESERWRDRTDKLEKQVRRLNELIGGEGKDASKALEELNSQVESLTKERDKYKGDVDSLKEQNKRREMIESIVAIAPKAKVDPKGLREMIDNNVISLDKVEITGEGDNQAITIDGKKPEEYFSDRPFLKRALMTESKEENQESKEGDQPQPQQPQQPQQPRQTPNGGTNSGSSGNPKAVALKTVGNLGYSIPRS